MVTASRRCDFALLVSVSMPSPCSSQSLGILSTNVTRGVSERRGRACVSESVWEESITVFALTYFWKIVRVSSP